MNRKRWTRIFKMCLGLAALMFFAFLGSAKAATLCVNQGGTDGCYSSIQAAVNAAAEGDLIKVGPGIYSEGTMLNKSLEIVSTAGPELTAIIGSATGVSVGSNRTVTIRGFTISGGSHGVYADSGILTTITLS